MITLGNSPVVSMHDVDLNDYLNVTGRSTHDIEGNTGGGRLMPSVSPRVGGLCMLGRLGATVGYVGILIHKPRSKQSIEFLEGQFRKLTSHGVQARFYPRLVRRSQFPVPEPWVVVPFTPWLAGPRE